MATRNFTSHNGNHRLTISTICTHLLVFHEAGMEFRTEKKVRGAWKTRGLAEQPTDLSCEFMQGANHRNPADFGVAGPHEHGYFKKSCVYFFGGSPSPNDLGNDARSVTDVVIRFTYNGQTTTFRHSDN